MTRKVKKTTAPKANTLPLSTTPDQSQDAAVAGAAANPCVTAATVATAYSRAFGDVSLGETIKVLATKGGHVNDGNMRDVESTLTGQASALNAIFIDLACAARRQECLPQFEANLKLALRAQNQCRMTLETLATIKNPPVVFAKQANIANNQQVNNGDAVPRTGENQKPRTGLLEAPRAKPEWMDPGATRATTSSNQAVEAVGAIDGTAHGSRQGKVKP